MRITCLVNNFSINNSFRNEEALSIYIETGDKKILFDTGMKDALFFNAKILEIPLEELDYVILSHGHKDHTGALTALLKINKKAKIIAHKKIFSEKYSNSSGELKFIGLRDEGLDLSRFIFIENNFVLEDNINIYGNLKDYENAGEKNHYIKKSNEFVADFSRDEIYLVIDDILVTGCSHRGIINIIKELKEQNKLKEDLWIFGGLHLRNKAKEELKKINDELRVLGIKKAFVNHCTFKGSSINRELDMFEYFFAGDCINLGGN